MSKLPKILEKFDEEFPDNYIKRISAVKLRENSKQFLTAEFTAFIKELVEEMEEYKTLFRDDIGYVSGLSKAQEILRKEIEP